MANRRITFSAVLLALMSGCGEKQVPPMPHNAVAQVVGALITPGALVAYVQQSSQQVSDDAVERSLEELIRFESAYAKATQEGFDRSPKVQAATRTNLAVAAATDEAIRSAAVKRIVVDRFLETHLGLDVGRVYVSEDEMLNYFRSNPDRFNTPETVRGAVIVLHAPPGATA